MERRWSLLILVLLGSQTLAQETGHRNPGPIIPLHFPDEMTAAPQVLSPDPEPAEPKGGFLSGNHNFPRFINFVSNPLQNIDPRAVTAMYPLFGSAWVSNTPPLPNADFQVYGPALTVALSERFAFGLNQGGYAAAHFSRNRRERPILDNLLDRFRDVRGGGTREGWLNLGGFFQYTIIQDVADQFLLTAGLRWEAPCGSYEIFQGHGPLHLAPYLTCGKELGSFHILATTGYQFPAGPGDDNTELFYANVHLDHCTFGWLYPLVEFNCIYHTRSVDVGLKTRRGFIDFGSFESSGNIVTLAAGANAVLIAEHLEIGAVYTTAIYSKGDIDLNGLLLKMVMRF